MDKSKLVLPLSLLVFLVVLIFLPLSFKGLGFFITVAIIETITLYFSDKKKSLICLIPILLIAGSTVVYDNEVWLKTNILAIFILYIIQVYVINYKLEIKETLFKWLLEPLKNFFFSLENLSAIPKQLKGDLKKGKQNGLLKKVLLGLIITFPLLLIIIFFLANADLIFRTIMRSIFINTFNLNLEIFLKIFIAGIITVGFFGVIYRVINPEKEEDFLEKTEKKSVDKVILNIILFSVNAIYLLFIIIQFRYLFAGSSLPNGLSYAEYARRGFFELLILTAINLFIIIIATVKKDKSSKSTTFFLYLLCTVTIILMASSFYRMYLYSADFGLTRLRLYVFIFLAFELIGLIATYFYIAGRKFNIIFTYFILCISYYTLLVVTPTDLIIARSQIKRYERDKTTDISYITELSLDALPEIEKLELAEEYYVKIQQYYLNHHERLSNAKWNEYNVANDNFKNYKNK